MIKYPALAALLVLACSRPAIETRATDSVTVSQVPPPLPSGEGRLAVPGGTIWYRVSGSGSAMPVVLLHGGPGYSSYYLKSLEALHDERPVIIYDQLGAGKSDHVTDTTLFTIPHFVAELDSLRAHLGYARWHVLGHSWGTILGLEYYRAHPDRVASLTLASAALDIPTWGKNVKRMIATLSDSAQHAIKAREADRTRELAERGYLARLWRLPPKAGSWLALGLWQARDGEELQAILKSLPMDKWMTTETTPLTEHPNDPAKAEV